MMMMMMKSNPVENIEFNDLYVASRLIVAHFLHYCFLKLLTL